MNKKMYLASLKLIFWQALYLGATLTIYYFLINIFGLHKLFDVLRINFLFNFSVFITSFILAVKTVKKKEPKVFAQHRLFLLFYALNIFILFSLAALLLVFFKGWSIGIILLILFLSYIYYYFCRLVYREAFWSKPWLSAIVLVIVVSVGYSFAFIPSFINYHKEYETAKVGDDFTYYHKIDLDGIVEKRELENENSAREVLELIKLINKRDVIIDPGEQLPYIIPTKEELDLVSSIANKSYLDFSKEFLSEKSRATGAIVVLPLNNLRIFYRGAIKMALLEYEAGSTNEALKTLDDLLLIGNQMIDAEGDYTLLRSVGSGMIRETFGNLLQLYEDDSPEAIAINDKIKKLDDMQRGRQSLLSFSFHISDNMIGSSKNTASFFKHLEAAKDNIGGDFDSNLAKHFLSRKISLSDVITEDNRIEFENVMGPLVILPIMMPYIVSTEFNIGNDYIIYREMKKLSKEPGHELLEKYFSTSYSDFLKDYEEASEEGRSVFYENNSQ